ncbi:MAG: DUF1801 domain-containing protein [Demequina sp.]|nr:DUF1801 domain-containing protein [Demequina sp.]
MAELKTQKTDVPVADFLAGVEPEKRRVEGERLHAIFSSVTGDPGVMWGPTMVGYGEMTYTYASGKTGVWFPVGFAPRKAKLSLYGLRETAEQQELLPALGPHTESMGCVYANRLDALDDDVLRQLIALGFARKDFRGVDYPGQS